MPQKTFVINPDTPPTHRPPLPLRFPFHKSSTQIFWVQFMPGFVPGPRIAAQTTMIGTGYQGLSNRQNCPCDGLNAPRKYTRGRKSPHSPYLSTGVRGIPPRTVEFDLRELQRRFPPSPSVYLCQSHHHPGRGGDVIQSPTCAN